jgi:hypothetical protein
MLAFIWGSQNLWAEMEMGEPESQQWTFGQVIAIVLLIVPIIALIEGYFRRKSPFVELSFSR